MRYSTMSKRKVTFEDVNEEFDLDDVPPNKKVSLHMHLCEVCVDAIIVFSVLKCFLLCLEL